MYVGRAQKKQEREEELRRRFEDMRFEKVMNYRPSTLFLKNLHSDVDEEVLRAVFEGFGPISSIRVLFDENGVSRGFGFITFLSQVDAARALQEMNGTMVHDMPIYVAIAQRKEGRRTSHRHGGSSPRFGSYHVPPAVVPFYPPGPGMMFPPAANPVPPFPFMLHENVAMAGAPMPMMPSFGMAPSPPMPMTSEIPNGQTTEVPGPIANETNAWLHMYNNADPMTRKQWIGQRLLTILVNRFPETATQVTTTLLERESEEDLLVLLNDIDALVERIATVM